MTMQEINWPVLKSYALPYLARIAMPLGGMGAGSISIGGHGELRDFELFNRPSKGFVPYSQDVSPCVMLHIRNADKSTDLRVAEGPIEPEDYEGSVGCRRANHGIPRFRGSRFDAAYPLAQVCLEDSAVPLTVRIRAFSPVIPGNADDSSLPIIQLQYKLHNRSSDPLDVATIATMPNFIGVQPQSREVLGNGRVIFSGANQNRNSFRQDGDLQGLFFSSEGVKKDAEGFGTFAIATSATESVSARTCWLDDKYSSALLDFRNDLETDGRLSDRDLLGTDMPTGSLAVHAQIPPGESKTVTFFLTWHFPNRRDWTGGKHDEVVGNWYTTEYSDAWDVAKQSSPRMEALEAMTVNFVNAFCESDLPQVIKEAMLFNVANLFTETCQRLPDGTFCGYEGCGDNQGYCEGSCTHVWNYEQALPFLWGDLAKSMRDVEYDLATGEKGDMAFRVMQPFETHARDFRRVAADGQMGCILKMYREWHLSGDTDQLRRLWLKIRKSMEYCWTKGSWDADQDGVMEGCQHNTMDVEYYGPNPQIQLWYLGALRAAAEMAAEVGDLEFEQQCHSLFIQGSSYTDQNLFNGEYYEHLFIDPEDCSLIPVEQRLHGDKPVDARHQLLDACLIDQCVGQLMSHICGLGYLVAPENIQAALSSIGKYNARDNLHGHFNVMRTFALAEESALVMASYPRGDCPEFPFPYFSEVMTGFEYTAAAGMIYEGQREAGLNCIANIRSRFDGRKRNPFDEAECGHHYARAMASWAAGLAWTGFNYSAITETMQVNGDEGRWFWSNGFAWGTYELRGNNVRLAFLFGEIAIKEFIVRSVGHKIIDRQRQKLGPDEMSFVLEQFN